MGQDRLAHFVRRVFSEQVLGQLLQASSHSAKVARVAASVGKTVLKVFRKTNREKRINLNILMSQSSRPDGICALAERLITMVAQAMDEALKQVGVVSIAVECWNAEVAQSDSNRRLIGQAKQPNREITRKDFDASQPLKVQRIIEREGQHRALKSCKGDAPGTLRGQPQVRHGRVTGIRGEDLS
mmetsp:Transcript_61982/g.162456  ORF Transcript_61982/g.162456 Transcript_61982/m.162456 type:complete len:185 (-) Transcript_61982:126-680(-)